MVTIRPFCALRYNREIVSDLSRVIAPPYDVIDAPEQERLYQASPYNIVRLILGKQLPSDADADNRYTRALRDFDAWRASGVLHRDPTPALYLIEHTFADEGRPCSRLGFIALLEFGNSIERTVYRHEATMSAPKRDRARLLEALPANLEPIFCVYPDEGGKAQSLLRSLTTRSPTGQAMMDGEEIRLWAVTEDDIVQEIARALSSVAVLIADGHHRFEVAYAQRSRYPALMSYFVSMEEPSLIVRPIHRVVQHQGFVLLQALHTLCLVERVSDPASLTRWLQAGDEHGRFGYYDGHALYRVTVHPDQMAQWLMAPPVPLAVAALDVSLLHGLLLPRLGGPIERPGPHEADGAQGVQYTADASQALRAVDDGEGRSAWLLRGIPLRQVYALAAQGLLLPPKSTYFYPKVPSGLVINSHV